MLGVPVVISPIEFYGGGSISIVGQYDLHICGSGGDIGSGLRTKCRSTGIDRGGEGLYADQSVMLKVFVL